MKEVIYGKFIIKETCKESCRMEKMRNGKYEENNIFTLFII